MPVIVEVPVPQHIIDKHRPKPAPYTQRVAVKAFADDVWSPKYDPLTVTCVTLDYDTIRYRCKCPDGFMQARVNGEDKPAQCPKCGLSE